MVNFSPIDGGTALNGRYYVEDGALRDTAGKLLEGCCNLRMNHRGRVLGLKLHQRK